MQMDIVRPTTTGLEHLITPHFMHMSLLHRHKSRAQQQAVYEIKEVVQLRFAGDNKFSPVKYTDEISHMDGVRAVTFAERFATQYQQFLAGDAQLADGTPLERLVNFGISPAQISLCRAMKIHTVEALVQLEGHALKTAGPVIANSIKPMAKRYVEERQVGGYHDAEIAALREELAALKAGSVVMPTPAAPVTAEQLQQEEATEQASIETLTEEAEKDALKQRYAAVTGARPRGNPSLETLRAMVKEADAS